MYVQDTYTANMHGSMFEWDFKCWVCGVCSHVGGIYWICDIAFSVYCTGNNLNLIKINVNQIDETAAEGFHISHILLQTKTLGGENKLFYSSLTHPYLSLHSTHTSAFSVHSLVREPLAAKDMLDETHRVSIFNIWDAHAVNLLLHTRVQFFLKEIGMVY